MKQFFMIFFFIISLSSNVIADIRLNDEIREYPSLEFEDNEGNIVVVPDNIINFVKKYPETVSIIDYYKDVYNDPYYHTRPIDIREDLANDDVPLFLQWDKRWAFLNYGRETIIATSGCAPTNLSMVVCYFTKDPSKHPKAIADFSRENNYYVEDGGTYHDIFLSGCEKLGLKSKKIPLNENIMKKEIDAGNLVITLMSPGHFTAGGHFLILKGYDEITGEFIINDSNSVIRSLKTWSPQTIINEARGGWSVGI